MYAAAFPIVFFIVFCQTWSSSLTIKVSKLIDDKEAFLGKVFNFTLPSNAFDGQVATLNVSEAGSDYLPPWLIWEARFRSLSGVPDFVRDMFPASFHISVVAHGFKSDKLAQQVFTIRVKQEGGGYGPSRKDAFFPNLLLNDQMPAISPGPMPNLPPKCRFGDHVAGLLLFPRRLPTVNNDVAEPFLNVGSSSAKKLQIMSDVAKLSGIGIERVRLLDVEYLTGLAYSLRPDLSQLLPSGRLALFLILGCLDSRGTATENDTRSALSMLPLIQSISRTASQRLDAPEPSLIDTRLYRKVRLPRLANSEHQVLPDDAVGYTTQEADIEEETTLTTTDRPTTAMIRTRARARTRTRTTVPPLRSTSLAFFELPQFTDPLVSTSRLPKSSAKVVTTRTTPSKDDQRPQLKYNIGSIKCFKGVVCQHNISKYTFYDHEDGNTDRLRLSLKLEKGPAVGWLKLGDQNLQLSGLPMRSGPWFYALTATDSTGKSITDAFVVEVVPKYPDDQSPEHQFVISVNLKYSDFMADQRKPVVFVQKLAKSMEDPDTSLIVVNSIQPNPDNPNAILISWSNATLLDSGDCSADAVTRLAGYQQTEIFRHRMDDRVLPIASVQRRFSAACGGSADASGRAPPDLTPVEFPTGQPPPSGSGDQAASDAGSGSHWLLATVLPATVILALLLAAILIACLLKRRGRRGKKSSEQSLASHAVNSDPRSEFVSKGAPVIFPDEIERASLESKTTAHAPSLLKDERPPLAPPDFAATLNGQPPPNGLVVAPAPLPAGFQSPLSVTRAATRRQAADDDVEMQTATRPLLADFDDTATLNPLYRAPPPFELSAVGVRVNGGTRSPRPRHVSPQQREQPPYVPP